MTAFLSQWASFLREHREAAVATLLGGVCARPRKNGAQMLISASGATADTIGGGTLEADVVARAKEVLAGGKTALYSFSLTGEEIASSGMACGGRGTVLIYRSGARDLGVLDRIGELKTADGWLLFPLETDAGIGFVPAEGTPVGNGTACRPFPESARRKDIYLLESLGTRYLVQWIEQPGTLHILGAGHVARAIAQVAGIAGLTCVVYDDRPDYVNYERFPGARRVLLFALSAPPAAELTPKDMIVVAMRGHLYDKDCLDWALGTGAGHIGMLVSRRKADAILGAMLQKGHPAEKVRPVHTPIGLGGSRQVAVHQARERLHDPVGPPGPAESGVVEDGFRARVPERIGGKAAESDPQKAVRSEPRRGEKRIVDLLVFGLLGMKVRLVEEAFPDGRADDELPPSGSAVPGRPRRSPRPRGRFRRLP